MLSPLRNAINTLVTLSLTEKEYKKLRNDDTYTSPLLEKPTEPPTKKLLAQLITAQSQLDGITENLDKPIIASDNIDYTSFIIYFLLASAALWFGETAFFYFQYESSVAGTRDFDKHSYVLMVAAVILGIIGAFCDWLGNIFTVSPKNDVLDLLLSSKKSIYTTWSEYFLSFFTWKYMTEFFAPQHLLQLLAIEIPFFVCYFVGASAGFESVLPWFVKGQAEGSAGYYSLMSLDALLTIFTGIVYYYCFNSRPLAATYDAYTEFKTKTWAECDINFYRTFEAIFDCLVVIFYRSIGFAAIIAGLISKLNISMSNNTKLSIAMFVFGCTAINVVLTRCLKTAAPYFNYNFSQLTPEEKKHALENLSFSQIYADLNILSGLMTSSGIALLTHYYFSSKNDWSLPVSLLLGSAKLFISIEAQRDLVACNTILGNDKEPEKDPGNDPKKIADNAFSALAKTFENLDWLFWFVTVSCLWGREARLSSFQGFNNTVSGLFGITFELQAMIGILLLVTLANMRNEYKMFSHGMTAIMTLKIAEAYVQHCSTMTTTVAASQGEYTALLTADNNIEAGTTTIENNRNEPSPTSGLLQNKQAKDSFYTTSVLWNPALYFKGKYDYTPAEISKALKERETQLRKA